MRAITLRIFKKSGNKKPTQQSKEPAPALEPEGSSTSSHPSQLLHLKPNPQSEVNAISTSDDNGPREAPTRDLTSTFFEAATGTTVSGPAQFTSTSTTSNQFTVHINPNFIHTGSEQPNPTVRIESIEPSAKFIHTGSEQPNPVVRTQEALLPSPRPSSPLPVRTVNVIPSNSSNMETPYSIDSTVADADPPKDNEMYERLLRRKKRGFALYIPQPNRRLPIAYQRIGIRIGDVGIITPDGGFSFLFNICFPHDDPINPRILPEGFSPLQPALTDVDVVEFSRFNSGSYLASASIEKKENESNSKGLHFETSASEGAVLTMPEGATSLDLENDAVFSDYLEANVRKWYEFVSRVRGRRDIRNGQIRLVIGCDKTTAWGIATVSGMSQQTTTKLRFKALDTTNTSTTMYTWECSGVVEERVGPDRREIDALRNCDNGGHPLDTTLRNQCLFVRTMTATLSNDEWAKLSRNLGKITVEDSNTSSGTTLDPSPATTPSGSNTKSSNLPASYQGTLGPQSYAAAQSGIMISKMPDSSPSYHHPSDDVNQQLLSKFPNCRMAITNDHVWLSTFGEDEEIVSDPEQLLGQVLASHNVRIENGVLRLVQKHETPGSNSPSSLNNHFLAAMPNLYTFARHTRDASEDVDEEVDDGDDPEVDTGKCKRSLWQRTRQVTLKFLQRETARLTQLRKSLSRNSSRDSISTLRFNTFLSTSRRFPSLDDFSRPIPPTQPQMSEFPPSELEFHVYTPSLKSVEWDPVIA